MGSLEVSKPTKDSCKRENKIFKFVIDFTMIQFKMTGLRNRLESWMRLEDFY